MSQKRALVVDDSKSARAFLIRILERHELKVDAATSAEEAMAYLGDHQPDVIFMDHLMPGMDGFQALQAIKNNPSTATIPVMMYTSQEGELYLSQARALGAIGVLPKQIRPTDVSKVLEQLHLLGDLKQVEQMANEEVTPVETPIDLAAASPDVPSLASGITGISGASPVAVRAQIESALRDHTSAVRRMLVEQFDLYSERIVGDIRVLTQEQLAAQAASPPPQSPAPRGMGAALVAALGLAALAIAVLTVFWMRAANLQGQLATQLREVRAQLADAQRQLTATQAAISADAQNGAAAETGDGNVLVIPVPFGEVPMSGARVEPVQALLARLASQGFKGSVQLRYIPGRFCMTAGGGEALALAAAETPFARCDSVGNPIPESGSVSQRESVAFANMLAAARKSAGDGIDVQLVSGSTDDTLRVYPASTETLTAAEWNRAAAANNRVEARWRAAP